MLSNNNTKFEHIITICHIQTNINCEHLLLFLCVYNLLLFAHNNVLSDTNIAVGEKQHKC